MKLVLVTLEQLLMKEKTIESWKMKSQRIDTEKINLIEEDEKIDIDKVFKYNEIISQPKVSNIKQCHLVV